MLSSLANASDDDESPRVGWKASGGAQGGGGTRSLGLSFGVVGLGRGGERRGKKERKEGEGGRKPDTKVESGGAAAPDTMHA